MKICHPCWVVDVVLNVVHTAYSFYVSVGVTIYAINVIYSLVDEGNDVI